VRYRVGFEPRALADLEAAFDYILNESQSREQAGAWLEGLLTAGESLELLPHGHGYARENGLLPLTLRQLHYKSHRLIYSVDDTARYVRILRVRHAAMRPASTGDLE
jgi:plasmid stabilization system protein ParE